MPKLLRAFASDGTAATSIEYAVIAGGLSVAVLVAVGVLGGTMKNGYFGALLAAVR